MTMKVFSFAIAALLATPLPTAYARDPPSDFGIFKWIHDAPGGYFNPKQEFRYGDPNDPDSIPGMYATAVIEKGEELVKVPWSHLLLSDDPDEEGQMCCGTVRSVAREMRANETSKYKPYALYLNAQEYDQLPSAFHPKAQHFLQSLVGGLPHVPIVPPFEPNEWLVKDWYGRCKGNPNDEFGSKAALMVVQRSDDALVIPGYDMYNHRNGEYYNTMTSVEDGVTHNTVASRKIEVGEQIYTSYNECAECGGRKQGYGTAEILRDYGFIESFPQKWHFMDAKVQFEVDLDPEDGIYTIEWDKYLRSKDDDLKSHIAWFRRQMRRIRRVRNMDFPTKPDDVPIAQWEVLNEFADNLLRAMLVAVQSMDDRVHKGASVCTMDRKDDELCSAVKADTKMTVPHYDELIAEHDDLQYQIPTCDNAELMHFRDYEILEDKPTQYQRMNFAQKNETDDICMDLDNIVQICSSYRPQYHEYAVHGASRYIDKVKRVIFVGGGDSMLLHEALKYPDLELVVGLELDQVVVRKSFKYFQTQPHFDDPRVEWWFGDATKSLLLLPEEYWGTFDLVLVDLSETVMSFSVTAELDVFDALALLLNDDGVMVKNELYLSTFSEFFDHTIQLFYQSPIICSQAMVMGSNKVDFMHHEPKDHGVETLLSGDLYSREHRFDFLHDYHRQYAEREGKCKEIVPPEDDGKQGRSAGMLFIVDAEETTAALDEKLKDKLSAIVKKAGLKLVTPPTLQNNVLFAALEEGYILGRLWPDRNYVGFDINLWGSFHKMKDVQASLIEMVGSKKVSAYRILVGGMYGCSTWKEDKRKIGPQPRQLRNCDPKPKAPDSRSHEDLVTRAFHELFGFVEGNHVTAVVLCGSDKNCLAETLVSGKEKTHVHKIVACSGLDTATDKATAMYECEKDQMKRLENALGSDKIDIFVVDESISQDIVLVWNAIFSEDEFRVTWFHEAHLIMAWSSGNPREEEWRQHFLDRYRKQHEMDPITHGLFAIEAKDNAVELGLVLAGDHEAVFNLGVAERKIKKAFTSVGKDVIVRLERLHSGLFPYQNEWNPKKFKHADYDMQPGLDQFEEQEPFGRHTLFQLEPNKGMEFTGTGDDLKTFCAESLEYVGFKIDSQIVVGDIGDGLMVLYTGAKGYVVMVYDGRQHIDVSAFVDDDTRNTVDHFMGAVLHKVEQKLHVPFRDDMPRGVGRVINFQHDIDGTPEDDTPVPGMEEEEDDDDE